MSWHILTAIAVITESMTVLLQRVLLHNDKSDPIAFVIVSQGPMAILVALYAIVTQGFHPPDFARYWFPITATFVLYGFGQILYARTLQRVEASVFSLLLATSAIWVIPISAVLYHEHFTPRQWIGAGLIAASIGLLAERSGHVKLDRGILMGLLTGLVFGVAVSAYIYVGRHADATTWTALCPGGTALLVFVTHPRAIPKIKPILHGRTLLRMLLLGVFFSLCNIALLLAYRDGKAGVVAALEKTSLILTILLSVIFLRERDRLWQKALAAGVCFLGVLLLG